MAATAAAKSVQVIQEHQQSKAYRRAAQATEQMAQNHADGITATAMENQRREQRNAQMQMARARADAGTSNLLSAGSVAERELDLATRLEDEINSRTDAALAEADRTRRQGSLDAWNLRQQSRNAHNSMLGSALEAVANMTDMGMKAYRGPSGRSVSGKSGDGLR